MSTARRHTYGAYDLHDYQVEAIFSGGSWGAKTYPGIFPAWDDGMRSCIIQMATGTGKTIVMGAVAHEVIHRRNGRVLLLAERKKLLRQAKDKFSAIGLDVEVEMAGERALGVKDGQLFPVNPDMVVASVQTMDAKSKAGARRMEAFPPSYFSHILIDECHHAPASRYRRILDYFEGYNLLGVTATADRADGQGLGDIFEVVAYEYGIGRAVDEGALVNLHIKRIQSGISLKGLGVSRGDFTDSQIAERITPRINSLANLFVKYYEGRKSIIFMPDVPTSEMMAQCLRDLGVATMAVSGSMGLAADVILDEFTEDAYRAISSCMLLVEGYDEPSIACGMICRATKSRPLYSQMVGRILRKYPPLKKNAILIDVGYVTDTHSLVHPIELFVSQEYDPLVLDFAKEAIDSGVETDMRKALDEAEAIFRVRQVAKVHAVAREIAHTVIEYDAFAVGELIGVKPGVSDHMGSGDLYERPAFPKQVEELKKYGVKDGHTLTYRGAKRRLKVLKDRESKDLAILPHVAKLIAAGIDPKIARKMEFGDAIRTLARFKAQARRLEQQSC